MHAFLPRRTTWYGYYYYKEWREWAINYPHGYSRNLKKNEEFEIHLKRNFVKKINKKESP